MSAIATILRNALEAHVDIHGSEDLLGVAEGDPAGSEAPLAASEPNTSPVPLAAAQPKTAAVPPAASRKEVPARTSPPALAAAAQTPSPESPYARIGALIPKDSPLHAFTSLEEVSDFVAATELIALDRTRINPVFGVGNPTADLMVIGEAPGADEDAQGEPFVGRAGQLLTKILQAIGFEREDVYIANILKSRPPNNRDPLPEEIAAHVPVLYKQMTLIQPKLILCVGKTAGNSLLGRKQSLASMRGMFLDFHGLEVLVTYHPAALLRNPNWKRPTWDDVQLLKQRYDELTGG